MQYLRELWLIFQALQYFFEKAVDELEYDGFLDRSRLTNNADTNNTLIGRRYYLDHQYDVKLGGNDKMKNYEKPKAIKEKDGTIKNN